MWVPYSFSLIWDVVIVGVGVCVYVQLTFPLLLTQVLSFLGKHSFNIFLFHTFFLIYVHQYIYWSKNPILIFMTLLLLCIIVSIVIECIKQIFGIYKFQELLTGNYKA